ncbi:septum formation family protein [Micromonospora sp. CPCC 205711]|uniref:septum formation family protein n=1 Tax=Micromonospora sp. CPCC 205547 TaxID=3122400 RepID=UPI002FEF54AA
MTRDRADSQPTERARRDVPPPPPGVMEVASDGWEPWAGSGSPRGRMSRLAVATFLLGLLGGVLAPLVGVVALVRIRRTGGRGRGLVVAGLVLFGVWVLAAVLVLTVVAPRPDPEGGLRGLRVGECFRTPSAPPGTQTAPERVTEVPCAGPHDGELVDDFPAYERYPDERYPGSAALSRRAETRCAQRQRGYVLDPLALPTDVRLRWYVPSRIGWRTDPRITCYLTGGATPLTRPLRADATVLRPEQLAYLTAVRDYTEARADLVGQAQTATPEALRDALKRTEEAHTRMWFRLRGETWPASARPAIDGLLAEMEQAEPSWRDADRATDRAALLKLVAQIERHPEARTELAVRQALGLPTAQGEPVR